ncbi:WAP four-disulfide core domain protein 1 [Marmota marmota marmota]|uniref:WAP four-disulfide core domain protein 1 n=1 Tax=Marmota marmota marmota TaxID=9994 RepID=UPI002093F153|nr:WAP four-disulfide core domain protein 1 [Marmota marmota marmota]
MGSCRGTVAWALCFLLLLAGGSAGKLWKRALPGRQAEKPHAEGGQGLETVWGQSGAQRDGHVSRGLRVMPGGAGDPDSEQWSMGTASAKVQRWDWAQVLWGPQRGRRLDRVRGQWWETPEKGGLVAPTLLTPPAGPGGLGSPGACQAARCQADSECPRHRRCCYNGCAYACLEAVPPPPVLDWLVQPKPRWLGGNGWLLDGPEEVLQAEACSTTEDGAEPLQCPSGYECHILSPGDVAEGIPNRGQCVKQRRPADGRFLRHRFYKEYPEGDSKNVAEPGKGQPRSFQ